MHCALCIDIVAQEKNMIDGVVWVVGDEAILRSDVEQERIRAQYEGQRIQGDPYCVIPEQIAIQKLFIHQAKIDSIEVNDGQVESQVNSQMNFFIRQIGSREKLEEYYRKTYSEIKEEMRQTIADQSLVQQVQHSLVQNIKVTPSDVRKYYSALSEDSIPTIPAQVEVQIITIEPPIPEEVIEAIVAQTISEVEGVNGLDVKPGADIAELIGKKNWGKGMKIVIGENNELTISCNVQIVYGNSVIEVAKNAQQAVAAAVENAAGVTVKEVNINICGIVRV